MLNGEQKEINNSAAPRVNLVPRSRKADLNGGCFVVQRTIGSAAQFEQFRGQSMQMCKISLSSLLE